MTELPREGCVRKVAVIGAGTMGPGIALTFARHGHAVSLCDRRAEALERAERVTAAAAEVLGRQLSETDIFLEKYFVS